NLVLGRVPTDSPLAGEVALDAERARTALSALLGRLPGLAGEAALADGIVRIAVAKMVGAIKEISIAKGHDPRDFALVAYGGAGTMAEVERAFHAAHERRYGHATTGATEIVNFRLTAIGAVPKPPPRRWAPSSADTRQGERSVHFGGEALRVPVYARDRLPRGAAVPGPAIAEAMGATTVIPPDWGGTVGEWGELVLRRSSLRRA